MKYMFTVREEIEDMDENVIYEVVAKAIANKAAGRTAWLGCTEQETKAN